MHKNIFFLIHLLTLLVNNNLPFCSPFYYTKILFTHLQFIHNIVETVYFFALMHKLCSIQLPHYLSIDYLAYRSLTNYRLWTPMLRFVLEIIKLYNVRERRVCIQNWGKPSGFCNERSLYFVNILRLSCTTRSLGALRWLVVTTLYVLSALMYYIY